MGCFVQRRDKVPLYTRKPGSILCIPSKLSYLSIKGLITEIDGVARDNGEKQTDPYPCSIRFPLAEDCLQRLAFKLMVVT